MDPMGWLLLLWLWSRSKQAPATTPPRPARPTAKG